MRLSVSSLSVIYEFGMTMLPPSPSLCPSANIPIVGCRWSQSQSSPYELCGLFSFLAWHVAISPSQPASTVTGGFRRCITLFLSSSFPGLCLYLIVVVLIRVRTQGLCILCTVHRKICSCLHHKLTSPSPPGLVWEGTQPRKVHHPR